MSPQGVLRLPISGSPPGRPHERRRNRGATTGVAVPPRRRIAAYEDLAVWQSMSVFMSTGDAEHGTCTVAACSHAVSLSRLRRGHLPGHIVLERLAV